MGEKKMSAVFILFLLSVCLVHAGRPGPETSEKNAAADHQEIIVDGERAQVQGGCEGVGEEVEECLMRRTLAAHTDYIYTQGSSPHV